MKNRIWTLAAVSLLVLAGSSVHGRFLGDVPLAADGRPGTRMCFAHFPSYQCRGGGRLPGVARPIRANALATASVMSLQGRPGASAMTAIPVIAASLLLSTGHPAWGSDAAIAGVSQAEAEATTASEGRALLHAGSQWGGLDVASVASGLAGQGLWPPWGTLLASADATATAKPGGSEDPKKAVAKASPDAEHAVVNEVLDLVHGPYSHLFLPLLRLCAYLCLFSQHSRLWNADETLGVATPG